MWNEPITKTGLFNQKLRCAVDEVSTFFLLIGCRSFLVVSVLVSSDSPESQLFAGIKTNQKYAVKTPDKKVETSSTTISILDIPTTELLSIFHFDEDGLLLGRQSMHR